MNTDVYDDTSKYPCIHKQKSKLNNLLIIENYNSLN